MQKSNQSTLSSCNKSPLNNSFSKAMYSFTKGQRFPLDTHQSKYGFYEKNSMLSKRATGFGYGKKVQIGNKSQSPSPDKYQKKSQFQRSNKFGLSLAKGRQDCKSVSIFRLDSNPGVGSYRVQNDKENVKPVTMSSKLKFPSLWCNSQTPGPGAYKNEKVDANGLCLTSKFRTQIGFKIHPRDNHDKEAENQKIGPGSYNTSLSSNGKQIQARKRTENSFVFNKRVRETFNQNKLSPGPGAYKHFSMFGQ